MRSQKSSNPKLGSMSEIEQNESRAFSLRGLFELDTNRRSKSLMVRGLAYTGHLDAASTQFELAVNSRAGGGGGKRKLCKPDFG